MAELSLQIIMTAFVWVNNLDWTEFRYWFEIPADIESYMRILKEKIKLPIAEIKSEIWEDMLCAMSDSYEPTDNGLFKAVGMSADKIDSATVKIHMESMAHSGEFRQELIAEGAEFRGWSPALHNVVEDATYTLSNDMLNMLVAMAKAYYNDSDGGGDPRYGLRRNNQTKQTDT